MKYLLCTGAKYILHTVEKPSGKWEAALSIRNAVILLPMALDSKICTIPRRLEMDSTFCKRHTAWL